MESATARAGSAGANDHSESRGVVRRLSTETKAPFKTTEFWAMAIVIVGILPGLRVVPWDEPWPRGTT